MARPEEALSASFRDPSGFLFVHEGRLLRQVNRSYAPHYDQLMASGLYARLVEEQLLIPHEEVSLTYARTDEAYKVLAPQPVPFISYPYEWCFSQLKDAALATLRMQQLALEYGMILKDASAYNIQFVAGRPVLIDTLSFEIYREGAPWIAYRQFCQHFLAPLALMAYCDVRLGRLAQLHLDGVPVDLAAALLPWRTKFSSGLYLHLHLHARLEAKLAARSASAPTEARPPERRVSSLGLRGLMDSLEASVRRLSWQASKTVWGDYYEETNYSPQAMADKERLVGEFLDAICPQTVWDLGANVGRFSRLAAARGAFTVAFDYDPLAVERHYQQVSRDQEKRILPLLLDLTNPSPALGWQHRERMSLLERGPADAVLALALIHHLAIGSNLPFEALADFFAAAGRFLIVEFVPKDDSQVQRLLATREDIFPHYSPEAFEAALQHRFRLRRKAPLADSARILYLWERHSPASH